MEQENGTVATNSIVKMVLRDGKLHRKDDPAIEYPNGTKEWFSDGVRHREDGPAVERADGSKEWWLNGRYFNSFESFLKKIKNKDQKLFLALRWG